MAVSWNQLYPDASRQQARYQALASQVRRNQSAASPVRLFSAPGRTELCGNHTDHQLGHVLAASVAMDIAAAAAPNNDGVIRVQSEGYAPLEIAIDSLAPRPEEQNTSAALVRGIAAAFAARGVTLSGFDLAMQADVPQGSGLSSSAAFEVLVGEVMNALFAQERFSPVALAQIGQWAENQYFGKPCGLMDQLACAVGGVTAIDLHDPAAPTVERMEFDPERLGYTLCILKCGADHADLTAEYGAIPAELKKIAAFYGKKSVLQLDRAQALAQLSTLRRVAGDRAVLRMLHIWQEDARVCQMAKAVQAADMERYLTLMRQSGESSWMYLQNVVVPGSVSEQSLALMLAMCAQTLGQAGAYRVHGGGFAGTAQALVPTSRLEEFRRSIDRAFFDGACVPMRLRSVGCTEIVD